MKSISSASVHRVILRLKGDRVHRSELNFDSHAGSAQLQFGSLLGPDDVNYATQPGGLSLKVDIYATDDNCPPPPLLQSLTVAASFDEGILLESMQLRYLREPLAPVSHHVVGMHQTFREF